MLPVITSPQANAAQRPAKRLKGTSTFKTVGSKRARRMVMHALALAANTTVAIKQK